MSSQDQTAAQQSQPRKLYKPRRDQGEMSAEVVVTYGHDGEAAVPCDSATADVGGSPD